MRTTRAPDDEWEALVRDQQLVLLNTWSCGTFQNGDITLQIDFIITRRRHADSAARQSMPIALDLAPWRLGPKHRAAQDSLPNLPDSLYDALSRVSNRPVHRLRS